MDYVNEYVGRYPVTCNKSVLLKQRHVFYDYRDFLRWLHFCVSTLIEGGLNFSSSQTLPQPPDNRTIQNIVEDYVNEYVGRYTWLATCLKTLERKIYFLHSKNGHLYDSMLKQLRVFYDYRDLLCWLLFFVFLLISRIFNALFSAGLNLSSPEPLPQSPENKTIQNFVKDFVDEYISERGYIFSTTTTSSHVVSLSFLFKMNSIFLFHNHQNRRITEPSRALSRLI